MIDTSPDTVTLPALPEARPSQLVRSMDPDLCCTGDYRTLSLDGRMMHCALGLILSHHPGVEWGYPGWGYAGPHIEGNLIVSQAGDMAWIDPYGHDPIHADTVLGWPTGTAEILTYIFDEQGRDAAADYLESVGL